MKGIRFTLGAAIASSMRERDRERVCVGSKHRGTAEEKVLMRSIPICLVLREPADSLATPVITYGSEDRLTQKNQQLSQEPSTSRQWMANSNDPFIYS